jgi:hypothetical protein
VAPCRRETPEMLGSWENWMIWASHALVGIVLGEMVFLVHWICPKFCWKNRNSFGSRNCCFARKKKISPERETYTVRTLAFLK